MIARATTMTGAAVPRRAAPVDRPAPVADRDEAWAEAVARLVRSHQARLAAPDPSRPWLAVVDREPGTSDG